MPDWTFPVDIIAQSIGNIAVDIAAQTIGNLTVDIAAQSLSALNVNLTGSEVTLNVNIESQTATLNVNIESQTAALDVWLTGSEITLDVNIASQTAALNVNIESQTTTIDVNIASSVTLNVTGSVTVTSGTVNVQTSGGANIVIDKLTQDAFTPRRVDYFNHGASATMTAITNTTYRGKWFPRGCRGYLDNVQVYCDNPDTSDHTITVYLAPQMGMAPIYSAAITVPAGASADWRFAHFRLMWNYDSMFVYVIADNASYPRIGYDTGTPIDAYHSTDLETWTFSSRRYWIKLGCVGLTVGDLPVSGTVNTIQVPNVTTAMSTDVVTVSAGGTRVLAEIAGAGELALLKVYTNYTGMHFNVYVDGELVRYSLTSYTFMPATVHADEENYQSRTVTATRYNTTLNAYVVEFTVPLPFKRSLRVEAHNPGSADHTAGIIYLIAKKIG